MSGFSNLVRSFNLSAEDSRYVEETLDAMVGAEVEVFDQQQAMQMKALEDENMVAYFFSGVVRVMAQEGEEGGHILDESEYLLNAATNMRQHYITGLEAREYIA